MKVREAYLKYRVSEIEIPDRYLATPEEVYQAFKHLNDQPIESFIVVYLNARNQVMYQSNLGVGTVDHCVVYPREIFVRALMLHASGILCVHNHPSGDVNPSHHDLTLTEGLVQGARVLGIRFLDHMIIGNGLCYSFRHHGLLGP